MTTLRRAYLRTCLLAGFALATNLLSAQIATGTVEGRVINARTGEYLENARVTIEGTQLEAFTDSAGHYRVVGVPAGAARVRVFYTGLPSLTRAAQISAGQTAQQEFSLSEADAVRADSTTPVKLDPFTVSMSKDMEGFAIAINEQRFARNMVTVVSSDEFGLWPRATPPSS